MGIYCDPALRSAARKPGQCALPAHPNCESGDLSKIDVRRKPCPALRGSERQVVLHPILFEYGHAAVVSMYLARDGHRPEARLSVRALIRRLV